MRLKSFSVKKYRSITQTERIILGTCTVLVGPNNEGKSNILRALVLGMRILMTTRLSPHLLNRRLLPFRLEKYYDWGKDYPINLQKKQKDGKTELVLEFEPTSEELEEFNAEIKCRLSNTIPIRIEIGKKNVLVTINKRGLGSKTLSKKIGLISNFIIKKIGFEHIEAVRTAKSAVEVVTGMVERELEQLETNEHYVEAIKKIAEIQAPILESLSLNIKKTLSKFLNTIKNVSVSIPEEVRYRTIRHGCEIVIDDGIPTLLQNKGDGVQSLVALGILRHASDKTARSRNLVIAIEEPESHLHPAAIHELKEVLNELSEQHQLLLTTHNPLFIDRRFICNNIIVKNNKASPAKNISEIRKILGVRASDNLKNAEFVLVVEGETDRRVIRSLLSSRSRFLHDLLDNNALAIESLAGGSNLPYTLSLLRNSLCDYHVFLDNDSSGKKSYEKARKQGLIDEKEIHFSNVQNLKESEIEDYYLLDFYHDTIYEYYDVSLKRKEFKTKKKWSSRIQDCFHASGKIFNDRIKTDIKNMIADLVEQAPNDAIKPNSKSLDSFIKLLEKRIQERENIQKKDVADNS